MSFLGKIINTDEKLTKWDSRIMCRENIFNELFIEDIQDFIDKQDKYTVYQNCFLNNIFNSKVASCFIRKKLFLKCKFEIENISHSILLLQENDFTGCTFYIANKSELSSAIQLHPEIKEIFESNNNVVIEEPYIVYLSKKYSNNLNNVPSNLLTGISLNYADLTKCILPNDKDFFKNLSSNIITFAKFDNVNFKEYNMSLASFRECVFSSKCTISEEMMLIRLCNCTLPAINFNNYNLDKNRYLGFVNCSLQEGTVFPKDENFFLYFSVEGASLPAYDYSSYTVDLKKQPDIFSNCSFKEGSKLPNDLFKSENISVLKKLKEVPSEYLDCYIRYNLIKDPYEFLEEHHRKLSDDSFMILCKKYNLTL